MSLNPLTYPLDLPGDVVPFGATGSITVSLRGGYSVRKGEIVSGRGTTSLTLSCSSRKPARRKHIRQGQYPVQCQELPGVKAELILGDGFDGVGSWLLRIEG